jgi:hypothetical protein
MDGILRRWSRPAVTVLQRSRQEEAVLTVCKSWVQPSIGADYVFNSCYDSSNPCSPACDSQAVS